MGFFSKAGKKFKKFIKRAGEKVKRYAPMILAAAAVVYTAGAALGVAGAAGGWGGVAGGLAGKLGGGIVSQVVGGALTQAGYGAAIGGAMSKAGGGSFRDGATKGMVTGAATGGLMGGLGMQTDPLAGIGEQGATAVTEGASGQFANMSPAQPLEGSVASFTGQPVQNSLNSSMAAPQGATRGLMSGVGQWAENNQTLVGHAVSGLGQAAMAQAGANDDRRASKERYSQIQRNFEGTDFSGTSVKPNVPNNRGRYSLDYEYRYNPQSGRIERQSFGA